MLCASSIENQHRFRWFYSSSSRFSSCFLYSINRNAVFPLFIVRSLAWWACAATIRRKFTACNEPAVSRLSFCTAAALSPIQYRATRNFSSLLISFDFSLFLCTSDVARIIHYNTPYKSYFLSIGSLLTRYFPIQHSSPAALPRHATIARRGRASRARMNKQMQNSSIELCPNGNHS